MIVRMLFIVACLQATIFSFAQTEEQKQFMFERINHDAKGDVVLPKTESFTNKEELFKKAKILPVYKVILDNNNKPKLVQNKNYFLVSYTDRLYIFLDKKVSRLFENSTVIKDIAKFQFENIVFNIVYFTEQFSWHGLFFNPLLTNEKLDFIIDKGIKYPNILDFINSEYGSVNKYQEKVNIDNARDHLKSNEVILAIKNNYKNYQYNCPKDTTLVLKKMINWINQATGGITKNQEYKLIEQIKIKMNPFKYVMDIAYQGKIKDSTYSNIIKKSIRENEDANSKIIKLNGSYDFNVYNVNITDDLLNILTDKQFINYKKFIDVISPICETNNTIRPERYSIFSDVLEREIFFKTKNQNEHIIAYKKYSQKILEDCGCPFDTSVKREIIIR